MIAINILLGMVFIFQIFFFEKIEPNFLNSPYGIFTLIIFTCYFVIFLLFSKWDSTSDKPKNINFFNNRKMNLIFLTLSLAVIVMSVVISKNKMFLDWDSLALYDARAKFLEYGTNFSKMIDFSKYDNLNKYYYSLYPPYTSIIHYFLHKYLPGISVGYFYAINLVLFGMVTLLFLKKYLGFTLAIIGTFLVIANESVFILSIMQYTNLPFALFVTIGVFALYEYLKSENKKYLFCGSFFVAASIWIRFLEPIWIAVVLSFFVGLVIKKGFKKSIIDSLILFIPSVIAYKSWQFFSATVSNSPSTVLFNSMTILEPVVGIFTGSLLSILILFVKWFLTQLAICIAALFSVDKNRAESVFLGSFIIFTILIYLSGLYFVSFQSTWWAVLGDSLERSSIFLIPVALFLMLSRLNILLTKILSSKNNSKLYHASHR